MKENTEPQVQNRLMMPASLHRSVKMAAMVHGVTMREFINTALDRATQEALESDTAYEAATGHGDLATAVAVEELIKARKARLESL